MPIEYKYFGESDLRIADEGPGRIFGYASTFGNLDADKDIVLKGAYAATIPQFLKKGFVAFGHDWNVPIATPYVAREDDRGLYVEAEFHSDPESQRYRTIASERLARGLSMGLSIGYTVKDSERKDGARLLKELNLFEFSIVTVPANDEAGIDRVKAIKGHGLDFEAHTEQVRVALDEWVGRCNAGSELRVKEGRAISEHRRQQLADMATAMHGHADALMAMHAETAPKKEQATEDVEEKIAEVVDFVRAERRRLWNEYLRLEARLHGVTV